MAAGRDQRVHQLVAVREAALDLHAVGGAARRAARSALAGVSSPTAMPTRACLVGKLVSSTATRRSAAGSARSRAVRTASRATRAQRSGSGT